MPTTISMPSSNILESIKTALIGDNILNLYVTKTDTTFTLNLNKFKKLPQQLLAKKSQIKKFKTIKERFIINRIIRYISKLIGEHIRNTALIKSSDKQIFTPLSSTQSIKEFKSSLIHNNFQNYLLINNLS